MTLRAHGTAMNWDAEDLLHDVVLLILGQEQDTHRCRAVDLEGARALFCAYLTRHLANLLRRSRFRNLALHTTLAACARSLKYRL